MITADSLLQCGLEPIEKTGAGGQHWVKRDFSFDWLFLFYLFNGRYLAMQNCW